MTGRLSAETQLALARVCVRKPDGTLVEDGAILDVFVGATVNDRRELLRAVANEDIRYVVIARPMIGLIRGAARLAPTEWAKPWFVDHVRESDLENVLSAGARRIIMDDPNAEFFDRADRRVRALWRKREDADVIPKAFFLT